MKMSKRTYRYALFIVCIVSVIAAAYPAMVRFWYHQHTTCWWSYDWDGNLRRISFEYRRGDSWVQHGPTVTFYESGHIASWREYKDGKQDGVTVLWDDDGHIVLVEFWRKGDLLSPPMKRATRRTKN